MNKRYEESKAKFEEYMQHMFSKYKDNYKIFTYNAMHKNVINLESLIPNLSRQFTSGFGPNIGVHPIQLMRMKQMVKSFKISDMPATEMVERKDRNYHGQDPSSLHHDDKVRGNKLKDDNRTVKQDKKKESVPESTKSHKKKVE